MKANHILALGFIALGLVSGCGGSGDNAVTTVPTAHLAVTLPGGTVYAGEPVTVTVTALDAANAVVPTYAGTVHITTSDKTATLPADATLAQGTGKFTVTFGHVGSQTITASDTVGNATPGTSLAASVQTTGVGVGVIPGTAALSTGDSLAFQAAVVPQGDGAGTDVTWSIQEGATGGSITAAGLYTPPLTPGTYHVVATSVASPTNSGTATVIVFQFALATTSTGSMMSARGTFTATLLANGPSATNGKVLVAGGNSAAPPSDTSAISGINGAELYDPSTGTFASAGSMTSPRYAHTATLLPNGKVLVTGGLGKGANPSLYNPPPVLGSAELYDPSSGSFTTTGNMLVERTNHTATLISGGRVLIVGGIQDIKGSLSGGPGTGFPNNGAYPYSGQGLSTAEIYDMATGVFTATGSMSTARYGHTATLLADGTVLVTGGIRSSDGFDGGVRVLTPAEIYDPKSGVFKLTGTMHNARDLQAATLLNDGRVLLTGGAGASAEIFDPATGTFSLTGSMAVPRSAHTATLLSSGKVLVAGGATQIQCIEYSGCGITATLESFDPATGAFTPIGTMHTAHSAHTATLLDSGEVLLAGGEGNATAELYP